MTYGEGSKVSNGIMKFSRVRTENVLHAVVRGYWGPFLGLFQARSEGRRLIPLRT